MNAQPYKVIVVRTPEDKMKLSKYMLLNNAKFVNSASATLIVCCDLGIPSDTLLIRSSVAFTRDYRNGEGQRRLGRGGEHGGAA